MVVCALTIVRAEYHENRRLPSSYGDKWDFISSLYHSLGSVCNLQSSLERLVLLSSVTNNTNCPNFIIRYFVYVAFNVKHLKSH